METKTKRIDLKASEADENNLRKAAENMKFETGKKPNVSSTIMTSVKQYAEREPFFFDAFLYHNICEFYSLTLKYFQGIASDFEALKFGHITQSNFEQILSLNFSDLEKRYFTSIEENLGQLKLSNEFVEQNLRSGTEVPWDLFKENTEKNLKNIQYNLSRPHWANVPLFINILTLKDGIVTFSDDDKLRVKEKYCLIYIDSEPKREFLRLTLSTLEQLKRLHVILLKNGFYDLWGSNGGLFNIEPDTEELIFDKEVLKFINKI